MDGANLLGIIIICAICFTVFSVIFHFATEMIESITLSNQLKKQNIEIYRKISDIRVDKPTERIAVEEPSKPFIKTKQKRHSIPSKRKTKPTSVPINTNPSIKEYRLPDGSKIAFDTTKVEFSEKSVII